MTTPDGAQRCQCPDTEHPCTNLAEPQGEGMITSPALCTPCLFGCML